MKVIKAKEFVGENAWDAIDIASMNGISTRLHWTDQPYRWHINDGEEVFVVLDGQVDMHYRDNGQEHSVRLAVGDIFYADVGTEHVAHPDGVARVLVVETQGSV
ncbi:MAG: cupin domain-containing protein [Arenicella sp.]